MNFLQRSALFFFAMSVGLGVLLSLGDDATIAEGIVTGLLAYAGVGVMAIGADWCIEGDFDNLKALFGGKR